MHSKTVFQREMIDIELENAGVNEEQIHLLKKVGSNFIIEARTDFLNHAERGESLQNQYFVGKVQNRWHFVLTIFLHPNPISFSGGLVGLSTRAARQGNGILETFS